MVHSLLCSGRQQDTASSLGSHAAHSAASAAPRTQHTAGKLYFLLVPPGTCTEACLSSPAPHCSRAPAWADLQASHHISHLLPSCLLPLAPGWPSTTRGRFHCNSPGRTWGLSSRPFTLSAYLVPQAPLARANPTAGLGQTFSSLARSFYWRFKIPGTSSLR